MSDDWGSSEEGKTEESTEQSSGKPPKKGPKNPLPPPPKTPATKEVKVKLFSAYDAADKEYDELKSKIDAAAQKKSDAVKAICEQVGHGPFKYKGRELRMGRRGDTFFFKSPSTSETEEIG